MKQGNRLTASHADKYLEKNKAQHPPRKQAVVCVVFNRAGFSNSFLIQLSILCPNCHHYEFIPETEFTNEDMKMLTIYI